ncbi:conserved hypothetical protein [Ricinus communis]|uniref:Uncharacterized protein n=1 Tax=Ricinus communis TaxID=3988 RepID=B9T086_RICCO|nr:conserved hypothetical protein [Ricinus communis]
MDKDLRTGCRVIEGNMNEVNVGENEHNHSNFGDLGVDKEVDSILNEGIEELCDKVVNEFVIDEDYASESGSEELFETRVKMRGYLEDIQNKEDDSHEEEEKHDDTNETVIIEHVNVGAAYI